MISVAIYLCISGSIVFVVDSSVFPRNYRYGYFGSNAANSGIASEDSTSFLDAYGKDVVPIYLLKLSNRPEVGNIDDGLRYNIIGDCENDYNCPNSFYEYLPVQNYVGFGTVVQNASKRETQQPITTTIEPLNQDDGMPNPILNKPEPGSNNELDSRSTNPKRIVERIGYPKPGYIQKNKYMYN